MHSIKMKILAVLVTVLSFNVIGGLLVYRGIAAQKADGIVINLAGAQRMLSQKMTKEALLLSEGKGRAEPMLASAARFEAVLSGLRNGDAELMLPPSKDAAVLGQLDKVQALWTPFRQALEHFAGDPRGAGADLAAIVAGNGKLLEEMNAAVKMLEEDSSRKVAAMLETQAGVILVSILLGLGLGVTMAGRITRPLASAVEVLREVSGGDLRQRLEAAGRDEVGEMARMLNQALASLQDVLRQVSDSGAKVAAASRELAASSTTLSGGVQAQAANLEETASSLEQMTASTRRNAEHAREASQIADGSCRSAAKGGTLADSASEAMHAINSSSRRIADIVTTIDEIAFQTNLLALNAAVEAARAGSQGRGFAIVATEVRNLSQRSATAAREIKALIQDSVSKVDGGTQMVVDSGTALREIVASVQRVSSIVGDIATASAEQATGIAQLNRAVSQIDQVTQAAASQTEELSATAQALSEQAVQVHTLVSQFRV